MRKAKAVFALVGVFCLLSIYGMTMFFALQKTEAAKAWFMVSLFATILVPVIVYAMMMFANLFLKNLEVESMKAKIAEKKEKMKPIQAVIFDVGKVLVSFDWEDFLREKMGFDEDTVKGVGQAMFSSENWKQMDKGLLPDEAYLEQFIANAPNLEKEIRAAYERAGEIVEMMPYALDWVKSFKEKGLKVYILSNYSHNLYQDTEEKMKFISLMDGCIWSYVHKTVKPEPAIYEKLLNTYGLDGDSCIYIDDLQENIGAAKAYGIHGILFENYEEAALEAEAYLQ